MNNIDNISLLKNNTLFWSRLGFGFDPVMRKDDGEILSIPNDDARFARYHKEMHRAGVKLHTSIIPSGWIGPEQYDYSKTDEILDLLFQTLPKDALYIPRVKLNPPVDWSKANPEELFVYYGGPQTAHEIQEMVGTLKHDLFGYEAPDGYYQMNDDRPNVGGLISNQSFMSRKWLIDASKALMLFLEHVRSSPWSSRIIGCHFGYGTMGESVMWGRISGRMGDYGIAARKHFYDWGLKAYGNIESLRAVWCQPGLFSPQDLTLPSPDLRSGMGGERREFLRYDPEYRIAVDYELCISEANASNITHFARVIKETAGDNFLTGCFYGYILECYNSGYTGHLCLDSLLSSPHLDFMAAPTSYRRREAGQPGGQLAPAQSVNLSKMWVEELDIRTHLSGYANACADINETRTVFYREALKNIAQGSNYWWMDLGGAWEKSPRGWYDDPEIVAIVAEIRALTVRLQKSPGEPCSDILLLVDDESIAWHAANKSYHHAQLINLVRETNLTGASVDLYRVNDLPRIACDQYKLVVFLNCYSTDERRRQMIQDTLQAVKVKLWLYMPGIIDNGQYSPESTQALTGIAMTAAEGSYERPVVRFTANSPFGHCRAQSVELDYSDFPLPQAAFSDASDLEIWGTFDDGKPAIASKTSANGTCHICSILPAFKSEHIRAIAQHAGCHLFAPNGFAVYANSNFLSVFPADAINGQLQPREAGTYFSYPGGKQWDQVQQIPLNLPPRSFQVMVKVN